MVDQQIQPQAPEQLQGQLLEYSPASPEPWTTIMHGLAAVAAIAALWRLAELGQINGDLAAGLIAAIAGIPQALRSVRRPGRKAAAPAASRP